ncbi:MAG: hypothetical protein ABID83_04540, partial [Candidatus Omnitrophota bacterium]
MEKRKYTLKIISAVLTTVFLCQQIAWSAGETVLSPAAVPVREDMSRVDLPARGIRVPAALAQVETTYTAGSGGSIVNIQDCHSSLTAQHSIVNILKDLLRNYDVRIVAVEGASGYIDTSILGSFPDAGIKERTASYLMKEGRISAGEFFSVMTEGDVALYGAEDDALYRENVEMFRKIYAENGEDTVFLGSVLGRLKDIENKVYSPLLGRFVFKSGLHRKSKISFEVYWREIENVCRETGLRTDIYPNIRGFLDTAALENAVDFSNATAERKLLIDELMSLSGRRELAELVVKALSFEKGGISEIEYYGGLLETAEKKDIDPGKYRSLRGYIDYLSRCLELDIIGLQSEIGRIEESILEKLFSSSEERRLYRLVKITELMRSSFEIKLSREDAAYLTANIGDLAAADFNAFLN